MGLAEDYARQLAWRDWDTALDALPPLGRARVLDLGCGIGDLAAALAARGADVVGVDLSDELLAAARARALAGVRFEKGDLRALPDLGPPADGVWSSFAAAYFPDLAPVLRGWAGRLRPGGWMALTEVDDLWGHEPLDPEARRRLDAYAAEALAAGRYDAWMGRKLRAAAEAAGLAVVREATLADGELSSSGAAPPAVSEVWRARLDRMSLFRAACGDRYERIRDAFLACLAREDHVATTRVRFCLAVVPRTA